MVPRIIDIKISRRSKLFLYLLFTIDFSFYFFLVYDTFLKNKLLQRKDIILTLFRQYRNKSGFLYCNSSLRVQTNAKRFAAKLKSNNLYTDFFSRQQVKAISKPFSVCSLRRELFVPCKRKTTMRKRKNEMQQKNPLQLLIHCQTNTGDNEQK